MNASAHAQIITDLSHKFADDARRSFCQVVDLACLAIRGDDDEDTASDVMDACTYIALSSFCGLFASISAPVAERRKVYAVPVIEVALLAVLWLHTSGKQPLDELERVAQHLANRLPELLEADRQMWAAARRR